MRFKALNVVLLTSSSLLWLSLCAFVAHAAEPSPTPTGRKTDQLEAVVFAIPGINANFLPLVVAEEKGFYRSAGIRAKVQAMKVSVAIAAAATEDVAYVFASSAIIGGAMQGLPLRLVAYVNVGGFFLYARPDIHSVTDLKGKIIASGSIAGLYAHLLNIMLKANGLDPTRDVKFIYLGDDTVGVAAVKSGRADAAIGQLPAPLVAEKEGLRIIGNAADYARFATAAIGTTLERIRTRPQEVKEVIRGTLLGMRYLTEHQEESAQILSRWQKVPLDMAQRTLELMRPSWIIDGFLNDQEIQAVIEERKAALKLTREFVPSDVVDYQLLKEVQKELRGSK